MNAYFPIGSVLVFVFCIIGKLPPKIKAFACNIIAGCLGFLGLISILTDAKPIRLANWELSAFWVCVVPALCFFVRGMELHGAIATGSRINNELAELNTLKNKLQAEGRIDELARVVERINEITKSKNEIVAQLQGFHPLDDPEAAKAELMRRQQTLVHLGRPAVFECGFCQAAVQTYEGLRGKPTACPACGKRMITPSSVTIVN